MTITTSTSRSGPYVGAGTTGPFTVTFRFLENSHLRVIKTTTATAAESVLTLGTDYTVTGAGGSGGTVTLTAALSSAFTLTIIRSVPATQETDYTQSDPFPAQSHEDALDKLTMLVQQGEASLDGTIRVPESVVLPTLPVVATRANKLLAFDAVGNPTISAVPIYALNPSEGFIAATLLGAVGDGVTDDTATLQAVLDTGLRIDFGDQSMNYRVTGTLNVRDYAYLRGGGARIFQDTLQTPIFNCVSKTDVTFVGLTMTGKAMTTATAGAFVVGRKYSILTVGTTDYTLIGASSNTAGVFFTATGPGTGTGTASTFYNTPNSQDIGIKADRATNLTVAFCTFNGFAYSPLMVALWGSNIRVLHNKVIGPGASVLNPLSLPDPQVPGFRNCTGFTILAHSGLMHDNEISDTSQGWIIGQQSRNFDCTSNRVLNTIVEHGFYADAGCRNLNFVDNKLLNTKLIGGKVQWYDGTAAATTTLNGGTYVINSLGSTNFTLIGAASNTVGLEFQATGAGVGTGTVRLPAPRNIVLSKNTVEDAGGDGLIFINAAVDTVATLTGVTQANPGVFTTAAAHNLVVGDLIDIGAVVGMTPVNSSWRVSATPTATTFRVRTPSGELDTTAFPAYVSGGTVKRPTYATNVTVIGNPLNRIGQDGIALRYVNGGTVIANPTDTVARYGIYMLITLNVDVADNFVRNTQKNGIYSYSPIEQNSIFDNTLLNVGAAGDDTAGGSSGIFAEGDGGGNIKDNIISGELTMTKMLYGVQLGSGDKRQWSIDDNEVFLAESAIVALHGLDSYPLRSFDGNIGTSAAGPDALTGRATALPNRGQSRPSWEANAAPTTGFWAQESVVRKLTPAAGDPIGWVNVASGTPGTWMPFGKVHKVSATQALSGSYTPTITTTSNVTLATARLCIWKVDGDWVTVTGRVGIQATATPTPVSLHLSLPVASDLTASSFTTLFGCFASSANQFAGAIWNPGGGADQNTARFQANAATTANVDVHFTFAYKLA